MPHSDVARLRGIKTLPQLATYLREELDWPIESDDADAITFDYEAAELGLDENTAVRIKEIKQLRPLTGNQPWGIFFINFEKKRLDEFPKRESLLTSLMKVDLESVPSQILWRGLEDEAAPVFVVYKLLHEAFSNSPQFFRRFITSLTSAQPDRFSAVFSREALGSVVARAPGLEVPEGWLQMEKATGLTQGNLMLFVPANLVS